jgi:hypothetical protein
VNQVFQELESNPKLKNRVKIIGIGAGNSDFEVNFFQKTYDVKFPLFSDGDFALHQTLGEVRTPYFFGVRIYPDGTQRVFYSNLGGSGGDPNRFLERILLKSGLSPATNGAKP